jgi:hypothetical protein
MGLGATEFDATQHLEARAAHNQASWLTVTLAFLPFEAKVSECAMGQYGQASAPAAKRYDRWR